MREGDKVPKAEFNLLQAPRSLPILFESLYAATLSGRLHVIGLDEARHTRHLIVSNSGEVIEATEELPFAEVTGVVSCEGSLIVAGVGADNRPAVLRLAADRHVESFWKIPSSGREFQCWPRPVCVAKTPWLLSITAGPQTALQLVPLTGHDLVPPVQFSLDDDSDAIDVSVDSSSVLLARVHSDCQRLQVMRIAGSQVIGRVDVEAVRPTAPSLACVGDHLVLAWVTEPGVPHLQWFDSNLMPLGDPEVLPTSSNGEVERVQVVAMPESKLAIFFWAVNVVGDPAIVHNPDGTPILSEPPRLWPLWVAPYDSATHRLGPLQLVDNDVRLYSAVCVSGNLAVVHRGRETRLSMFVPKTGNSIAG